LRAPVTRLANKISSAPVKKDVFASLDCVLKDIRAGNKSTGVTVPFNLNTGRFVVFSDQHKGARDYADDFAIAENNYLAALDHYYTNGFTFINLGDCEELWENKPDLVMKTNKRALQSELRFLKEERYYRIFGNHDLEWKYPFQQVLYLKPIFGDALKIYEGIELTTDYNGKTYSLFMTHGHQGDKRSDGSPLSTWLVAAIWTPIQRFLNININTTSDSFALVDAHNIIMYDWSATQKDLLFISGHTHKPVFASLDHIDLLNHQLQAAKLAGHPEQVKKIEEDLAGYAKEYEGKKFVKSMAAPTYFNTGCCCFDDGDISGIEIEDGLIRLIKWETAQDGNSVKKVLEQSPLSYIFEQMG